MAHYMIEMTHTPDMCLEALDEEGLRKRLRAWIKAGGTWIVGPLADVRTMDGVNVHPLALWLAGGVGRGLLQVQDSGRSA